MNSIEKKLHKLEKLMQTAEKSDMVMATFEDGEQQKMSILELIVCTLWKKEATSFKPVSAIKCPQLFDIASQLIRGDPIAEKAPEAFHAAGRPPDSFPCVEHDNERRD